MPRITWILSLLYEFPVAIGWRHWRARYYRKVADRWAAGIIEDVRAGQIKPPAGSALDVVANHRDQAGQLLEPKVAGVELQNVLRPTVAVSVFVVYAAKMLHEHPECREQLAQGGDEYAGIVRAWKCGGTARSFPPSRPAFGRTSNGAATIFPRTRA